jgi:hypothetical protein
VWSPWLVATVSPSGDIATAMVDKTEESAGEEMKRRVRRRRVRRR